MYETPKSHVDNEGKDVSYSNSVFNNLVWVNLFLTIFALILSEFSFLFLSEIEYEAFKFDGANSIIDYPSWAYFVYNVSYIVCYTGIMMRHKIAKWSLLGIVSAGLLQSIFIGISVYSAMDSLLYPTMMYIDGAIIVLMFVSPIRDQFK